MSISASMGEPETIDKLRWLLAKAVRVFGERRLGQLRSPEIAAWRITVPTGHRFEATQALRQVLNRAVEWGLIDVNPAKTGVDNPQRRRTEKRPFESWDEVEAVAAELDGCLGPLVVFAAATGLRPGTGSRSSGATSIVTRGPIGAPQLPKRPDQYPKTEASMRAVPLQGRALAELDALPREQSPLVFPASDGGHFDLHNFRTRHWRPAQEAAGIQPRRRVYDLRHTFATFALRASCRHLNLRTLPLHGRQPDDDRLPLRPPRPRRTRARHPAPRRPHRLEPEPTSTAWTPGGRRKPPAPPSSTTETRPRQEVTSSPLTDSNRRPPPYQPFSPLPHLRPIAAVCARSAPQMGSR
jgi:integrase